MTSGPYSLRLNALLVAILLIASTQHLVFFRGAGFINIMLFDGLLLSYCIFYFRNLLAYHFDAWVKVLILMIFYQFIHNIWFSENPYYSFKELFQGIELVLFYLILRLFLSDERTFNKIIDYTFNILCVLSLLILIR